MGQVSVVDFLPLLAAGLLTDIVSRNLSVPDPAKRSLSVVHRFMTDTQIVSCFLYCITSFSKYPLNLRDPVPNIVFPHIRTNLENAACFPGVRLPPNQRPLRKLTESLIWRHSKAEGVPPDPWYLTLSAFVKIPRN